MLPANASCIILSLVVGRPQIQHPPCILGGLWRFEPHLCQCSTSNTCFILFVWRINLFFSSNMYFNNINSHMGLLECSIQTHFWQQLAYTEKKSFSFLCLRRWWHIWSCLTASHVNLLMPRHSDSSQPARQRIMGAVSDAVGRLGGLWRQAKCMMCVTMCMYVYVTRGAC